MTSAAERPWMAAADLFALPSPSEGTSRSLLEAVALGVPVVASLQLAHRLMDLLPAYRPATKGDWE